jgi:hypothetical protein
MLGFIRKFVGFDSLVPSPDLGVTTRFVQNRTLSEKSRDFIGFRKRSFAHEFGPDEDLGEFSLQNPLS